MANILHNIKAENVTYSLGTVHYIVGNTDGLAGTWTGSDPSISEYFDGLTIAYKVGIAGQRTATTLNINNLGAISVVKNAITRVGTSYPVNSIVFLVYTTDGTSAYWKVADYNSDTMNTVGDYQQNNTKLYLTGTQTTEASTLTSYATSYTNKDVYITTSNILHDAEGEVAHAGSSGSSATGISVTSAPNHIATATTGATPSGTAAASTATAVSVAKGDHTHAVTGTVSKPSFTGTDGTTGSAAATLTVSIKHESKSTGSSTIFAAAAANNTDKATGNLITEAGTWPSHSYTAPTFSSSIANNTMTLTFNAGIHSYNAGTAPTLSSSYDLSTADHTHDVSGGSHSHTYDRLMQVDIDDAGHTHSFTPAGTISQPTFTDGSASATATTNRVNVDPDGHTHNVSTTEHTHNYDKTTSVSSSVTDNGHTHNIS